MHLRLVFVPRRFFIAYFPVNNSLVPAGADKFLTGILLQLKRPPFPVVFLSAFDFVIGRPPFVMVSSIVIVLEFRAERV